MSFSSRSTYSHDQGLSRLELEELAQAISNLSTTDTLVTPTRHKTEKEAAAYDRMRIWEWKIKMYLPFFPNAEKILSTVELPRDIMIDPKRLLQFVNSTSITSDGRAFPPQVTEILPQGRLYLADEYSGTNKGELIGMGITHIVCAGPEGYHDQACPRMLGIEHAILQAPEDEKSLFEKSLVGIVDNGLNFIHRVLAMDSTNKVLIHCPRGDNWAPGIAIGVVMHVYGSCYDEAFQYVRTQRPNMMLHVMVSKAVQQWWSLEKLRHELPEGRGFRPFKWAESQKLEQ